MSRSSNQKQRCYNCEYWEPRDIGEEEVWDGWCFRMPPQVLYDQDRADHELFGAFPIISRAMWCGEFRMKLSKVE